MAAEPLESFQLKRRQQVKLKRATETGSVTSTSKDRSPTVVDIVNKNYTIKLLYLLLDGCCYEKCIVALRACWLTHQQ